MRIIAVAAVISLAAAPALAADPVEGEWLNPRGNAKIRIWVSRIPGPNDPLMANPYKWVPQAAGVGVQLITGSTEKPFGFREQGFYGFGVGVLARGI